MARPAVAAARGQRTAAKGSAKLRPVGQRPPTLEVETELCHGGHRLVGGCDEVGRGALAGPVTVGLVVVDPLAAGLLEGVRDSKLLRPAEREALVPLIHGWAASWGVGHASAAEIDRLGLVPALRLAGHRARAAAARTARPDVVLLDGNLDWLGAPRQESLFEAVEPAAAGPPLGAALPDAADGLGEEAALPGAAVAAMSSTPVSLEDVPVRLRIKADLHCLSVAAASVLAKVARDQLMVGYDTEFPGFDWAVNKGYGTAAHRQAIRALGPSIQHRRSWNLTGHDQAE